MTWQRDYDKDVYLVPHISARFSGAETLNH